MFWGKMRLPRRINAKKAVRKRVKKTCYTKGILAASHRAQFLTDVWQLGFPCPVSPHIWQMCRYQQDLISPGLNQGMSDSLRRCFFLGSSASDSEPDSSPPGLKKKKSGKNFGKKPTAKVTGQPNELDKLNTPKLTKWCTSGSQRWWVMGFWLQVVRHFQYEWDRAFLWVWTCHSNAISQSNTIKTLECLQTEAYLTRSTQESKGEKSG